jgi:hypothetical protein
VNWEKLPTIRSVNSKEYRHDQYNKKSRNAKEEEWNDYYDARYGHVPRTRRSRKNKKSWKSDNHKPKAYYNDLNHEVVDNKIKKLDPLVDYSKKDDILSNGYNNTFSISYKSNYLKPLKPLIFNERLNEEELNILAEQYFDLTDEQDLDFYSYLRDSMKYRENYL